MHSMEYKEIFRLKEMLEEAKNDPELNKPPSELPDYSSVNSFLCPITKNIMKNPVITPYGTTYDKDAIISWLKTNETCPLTKKPLNRKMLTYLKTKRRKEKLHCILF